MERFGLQDAFALIYNHGEQFVGHSRQEVHERVQRSALLLNIMGFLSEETILSLAPRRVFLDIDPGFGQMWRELGLADPFQGHDDFVTIGEKIGQAGCTVPPSRLCLTIGRRKWSLPGKRSPASPAGVAPMGPWSTRGKPMGCGCMNFANSPRCLT
jgi:hypothetical protein